MEGKWASLSTATVAAPKPAADGFEFLNDPMALVGTEERKQLTAGLQELDRLRRDVESESGTLRLA